MNITLRRPIYNPNLLVPGTDVAIDIPSIKTVLAESEYQFITSMAGDNFSEPLKVPQAAQWLQQYYSTDTTVALPEVSQMEGDRAAPEQAEAPLPSKQELFKQAVKAEKGESQKPTPPGNISTCLPSTLCLHAPETAILSHTHSLSHACCVHIFHMPFSVQV